jgi:hypothetical protein
MGIISAAHVSRTLIWLLNPEFPGLRLYGSLYYQQPELPRPLLFDYLYGARITNLP